ncbi:MAG: PBP1A family penicillin-binding protein [Rickettsiales bacterium]|jgi:penicillin-binding protein 1A|nr:PBP1A family penicillin-binding protein [Rickettsiales bacterium]
MDKKDKKEKKRGFGIWMLTVASNAVLAVVIAVAFYVFIVFLQMPSLDAILRETRAPSISFLDRSGAEIQSRNKIMETPVSVLSLPPHVWQSVVAIEDRRFFNHGPIDFRGLSRAVFSNLRAGHVAAGGSTITQQTAKNIFLNRNRTMSRKVQEVILSYWLENRFDKNQILDLYLNRVSLVGGLRGIDAASRTLFGHGADKMTVAESATIAAMLKAPTTYNPQKNPELAAARAKLVLKEMVRQNYISLGDARAAASQLNKFSAVRRDMNIYRYWTDFVLDEVHSQIGDEITSDIIVHTTLDGELQSRIANVVARGIAAARDKNAGQGAAVSLDPNGAIRAMVGGGDYQASQFNRVLAPRQPGSAFKPIVYLVALENGMTPDSIANDSPFSIGDYNPKNYNEKYYGDITLGAAFAKSVNSVPLKLTQQFGIDSVLKMAGRLGVGARLRREYSTVLGSSEMSLMDLATMYGVIWNNGNSVRPYGIEKITTIDGRVLYAHGDGDKIKLLDDDAVAYMQELLRDVVAAGGTGARSGAAGGKTGTSNDYRDAWFIGFDGQKVIGIWVGNDDNSPMKNITGGTIPAEIFNKVISY